MSDRSARGPGNAVRDRSPLLGMSRRGSGWSPKAPPRRVHLAAVARFHARVDRRDRTSRRTSPRPAAAATTSGAPRLKSGEARTRSAASARTTSATGTSPHRHTAEEPLWTHSLWLRLLAHTGIVGVPAVRRRPDRRDDRGDPRPGGAATRPEQVLAGAALLPLGVWLIHGSIDWFWEFPALSGPALGFLAMALPSCGSPPAGRPAPAAPGAGEVAAVAGARSRLLARHGVCSVFPFLDDPRGLDLGDQRQSQTDGARSQRLPTPRTSSTR